MSSGHHPSVVSWLGIGLVLLGLAGYSTEVVAQSVPTEAVKREFFTSLSPDQRLNLLEALDRGQQLTAQELGAKYRWGHIPPDRQPPFFLARWWKSLSPEEKQRQRLNWFRDNYLQLDLDRAARELELQDRLTRVYRQLRRDYEKPARKFEPISFPGQDLTFENSGEGPPAAGVYRPAPDTGSTAAGSPDPSRGPRSQKPAETPANDTGDRVQTSPERSSSPPAVTPTRSRPESDTEWKRVQRYEGGTVIYRREGNKISVVRRSNDGDTNWTPPSPEPEFEGGTAPRTVEPSTAPDEPEETSEPPLRFPEPPLRRDESRRHRLQLPPVRRR